MSLSSNSAKERIFNTLVGWGDHRCVVCNEPLRYRKTRRPPLLLCDKHKCATGACTCCGEDVLYAEILWTPFISHDLLVRMRKWMATLPETHYVKRDNVEHGRKPRYPSNLAFAEFKRISKLYTTLAVRGIMCVDLVGMKCQLMDANVNHDGMVPVCTKCVGGSMAWDFTSTPRVTLKDQYTKYYSLSRLNLVKAGRPKMSYTNQWGNIDVIGGWTHTSVSIAEI